MQSKPEYVQFQNRFELVEEPRRVPWFGLVLVVGAIALTLLGVL